MMPAAGPARTGRTLLLWAFAPTLAMWQEARQRMVNPHPFERWAWQSLLRYTLLLFAGAVTTAIGFRLDVWVVKIAGVAWLAGAGFKLVARGVMPRKWAPTEEDFVVATSGTSVSRVLVAAAFLFAVSTGHWTGALALGAVFAGLVVTTSIGVFVARWLFGRRNSHAH